jgi:hypothetical protein
MEIILLNVKRSENMTRQNKIHKEKVYMEMLIKSVKRYNQQVDSNDICIWWHENDNAKKKK